MLAKISSAIVICVLLTNAVCLAQSATLIKGDILAILDKFEGAWQAHDMDRLFSIYTDDAMFYFAPSPTPMSLKEVRAFCDDYIKAYPNIYVPKGFHMASAKDGVGVMEHLDIHTENGIPIQDFHICMLDFEGTKAKKFTNYSDWATDLIQAGAMPPRNLGDMIPSSKLPVPEATGLSPMKASAELLARLNSHDLSSVAKMLRTDMDFCYAG